MNLNELARLAHDDAVAKGWDFQEHDIPEKLCLVHSEVSEALEDFRNGHMETTVLETGKPVGYPTELADIVIRVLDMAHAQGIDLEAEIERKMAYNRTRGHRHGGKRC